MLHQFLNDANNVLSTELVLGLVFTVVIGTFIGFVWRSFLSGAHNQIFGRIESKLDDVIASVDLIKAGIPLIQTDVSNLKTTQAALIISTTDDRRRMNEHMDQSKADKSMVLTS